MCESVPVVGVGAVVRQDRKSTRLNSSHANISYAVFCLKKKHITSLLTPFFYLPVPCPIIPHPPPPFSAMIFACSLRPCSFSAPTFLVLPHLLLIVLSTS